MACILKAPTPDAKGIIMFTTAERDQVILKDRKLQRNLWDLKSNWMIGLHHNWHDFNFVYNPLFDFSMAGEEDLREVNRKPFSVVPMDACNFVPEFFEPQDGSKFWDILYVARPVGFKRIPEFFQCIRSLYDQGHNYRVLYICSIPPYNRRDRNTVLYDVRGLYDSIFSEEEKDRFTLLSLSHRYPFPFDLETLAFLYKSSRIFVHFSDEERRCRAAAYAWATGIPVVGMASVASLLPGTYRIKPYYYEISDYAEFPSKIVQAIEESQNDQYNFQKVREHISTSYTTPVLRERLKALLGISDPTNELTGSSLAHLDIRLGRHHGLGDGPNNVWPNLAYFVELLSDHKQISQIILEDHIDPERQLEKLFSTSPNPSFWSRLAGKVIGHNRI